MEQLDAIDITWRIYRNIHQEKSTRLKEQQSVRQNLFEFEILDDFGILSPLQKSWTMEADSWNLIQKPCYANMLLGKTLTPSAGYFFMLIAMSYSYTFYDF